MEHTDRPSDRREDNSGIQAMQGIVIGTVLGVLVWALVVLGVSELI